MPVKNIVIPLETSYLNEVARSRGVSRTRLVRLVMERVVDKRIVDDILGTEAIAVPKPVKYRRFAPKT